MRVTFLGTGTSRGVPTVGCDCRVCRSSDPKNKRLRSSIWIKSEASVVIDASVDFRTQMLRHNVARLDAIVLTHAHMDHILGLDDAYPLNLWANRTTPVYAGPETLREVQITFRHLFREEINPGLRPVTPIPITGTFRIGDLEFEPVEVMHGESTVLGFRIGDFAYVTDVSSIPEGSFEKLRGLECLVLDGLRYESHPKHFTLAEAAETAEKLGAARTYLIHMSHDVDHQEGSALLPPSVSLSYDGQVLEID